MRKGWAILNYHDIGWEEGPYTRGIGGNFPPDIFREHLAALSQSARLVSVQEGFQRFQEGRLDEPLVSIWFDDGLAGVRRYAWPILAQMGLQAAISINSRFMLRQEMFWRFKLSFLSHTEGMRFLRSRLRKWGYRTEMSVRAFVMDHFSEDVLAAIDGVYQQFTRGCDRADAFRIFDDAPGIACLRDQGWEIANHSAGHYPVAEDPALHRFSEEFLTCERDLAAHLGVQSRFWVIPFARQEKLSSRLAAAFAAADDRRRTLVLMGARWNTDAQRQGQTLYRLYPPPVNGAGLLRFLRASAAAS